jgi:hypothetical protein
LAVLPEILKRIPRDAFAFFLIDPKGWRIPLRALTPMLARSNSEVIFNFMFDFINRAVSIDDDAVIGGLDELIPYGEWRTKLSEAEQLANGKLTSSERKAILVGAFTESLGRLGNYRYVAETTILRPLKDRPLYCLCYATRNERGIEVFRDCQIKALTEQANARAAGKMKHAAISTGQGELFESLYEMAPNELTIFLENEIQQAKNALLGLTPPAPDFIRYDALWPQILLRHVLRLPDLNKIAAQYRNNGTLLFPDWEYRKRVPQQHYRVQRP